MNDDMHDMIDKASKAPTDRRRFLKGAAAAGVGVALAPYLGKVGFASASTAPSVPAGTAAAGSAAAAGDAINPFGMADASTVDAVIFDGGYGTDYVQFAADIFGQVHEGSTAEVSPSTQIASELQPRFVSGNPPDLIDNSGAQSIGIATILDQLEDLNEIIDAPNLEGVTIRDTLYGGVLKPGTFGDKLAAINYALTVYGMWYSSSLFEENGWTPPTTWEEAKALGAKAKEQDKYLFLWGKEAATYYRTMALESAIKEGGDEVRLAIENLEEGAWSLPAVQAVFTALKEIIDLGYMKPGGGGTQFTQAQAQWSLDQDALLYPSGSWIENEMKAQTAEGFAMKGVPTCTVTADSVMPATAVRLGRRRAVHRPDRRGERGRRQGAAADHAVERGGDQLRQDEAGPDDRLGPRPRGRVRLDGARVADRHARRRRRGHLQLRLLRRVRHQPGRAAALELVPGR